MGFNATRTCVTVDSVSYMISPNTTGSYSVDVHTGNTCDTLVTNSYVFSTKDIGACRINGAAYYTMTSQRLDLPLEVSIQTKCKAGTVCKCPVTTAFPSVKIGFILFEVCHPALNEGSGFQTYSLNFSPRGFYEVRLYRDYNCLSLNTIVFNFDASEVVPYGRCLSITTGAVRVQTLFPRAVQPTSSPTIDRFGGSAAVWAVAINVDSSELTDDSIASRNLRAFFAEKMAISAASVLIQRIVPLNVTNAQGSSLLFEAFDPDFNAQRLLNRLGPFRYPLENLSNYNAAWRAVFSPFGSSAQQRSTTVFSRAFTAFQASIRRTVAFVLSLAVGTANIEASAVIAAQQQLGGNQSNYYCSSSLVRGGNIFVMCEVLPSTDTTRYVSVVQKKYTVLGTCFPGSSGLVFRPEEGPDVFAEVVNNKSISLAAIALFFQSAPNDVAEYTNTQISVEVIKEVTQKWTFILAEVQPTALPVSGPLRTESFVIEQLVLGTTSRGQTLKLYGAKFNAFVAARGVGNLKSCFECACGLDAYCCDKSDERCSQLAFTCMPCDLSTPCFSHEECAANEFCSSSNTCMSCSIYRQVDCLTFNGECCWEVSEECAVASCEPSPAPPLMQCEKCCVRPSSGENCANLPAEEIDGSCCPTDSTCCPLFEGVFGRGSWTCCGQGEQCTDGSCESTSSPPISVGLYLSERPFVLFESSLLASIKQLEKEYLKLLNSGSGGVVTAGVGCAAYTALSRDLGTAILCEVRAPLDSAAVSERLDEIGSSAEFAAPFGPVEFEFYGSGFAGDYFDAFMQAGGLRGCQDHVDCLPTAYCTRYGDCMPCASMPVVATNCDSFDDDCCAVKPRCGLNFDPLIQCDA